MSDRLKRDRDATEKMMKLKMALDEKFVSCPACGHSGPVSSDGDHWDGCPILKMLTDGYDWPPYEAQSESEKLRAALQWIKNDLAYKAPELVAPDISERIVNTIDAALTDTPADHVLDAVLPFDRVDDDFHDSIEITTTCYARKLRVYGSRTDGAMEYSDRTVKIGTRSIVSADLELDALVSCRELIAKTIADSVFRNTEWLTDLLKLKDAETHPL